MTTAPVTGRRFGLDDPALTSFGTPLLGEVVEGVIVLVGGDVNMGCPAGTAHSDAREFLDRAVGEDGGYGRRLLPACGER